MDHKKSSKTVRLDKDTTERICALLRAGNTYETAAEYSGVARSTLFSWLSKGKRSTDESDPHRVFYLAARKARSGAHAMALSQITKAFADSWQAAAWYLERSHPLKWGRDRDPLKRKLLRLDCELKRKQLASLERWDEILADATAEDISELQAIAARIKSRKRAE